MTSLVASPRADGSALAGTWGANRRLAEVPLGKRPARRGASRSRPGEGDRPPGDRPPVRAESASSPLVRSARLTLPPRVCRALLVPAP